MLPELRDVQRMLLFKHSKDGKASFSPQEESPEGGAAKANAPNSPHEPSSGLQAAQQMGASTGVTAATQSALLKGLPSSSSAPLDELDLAIAEREQQEAWHVATARREEAWKLRQQAQEQLVSQADREKYRRLAAEALHWALPSLEAERINAQFDLLEKQEDDDDDGGDGGEKKDEAGEAKKEDEELQK